MKQPNRLGWVTELTITDTTDVIDVTTHGSFVSVSEFISGPQRVEADIHLVASNPGALMEAFQEWMNGGLYAPSYQKEFMCLYCGSPNSINKTHCKKCGAPRSFVIG